MSGDIDPIQLEAAKAAAEAEAKKQSGAGETVPAATDAVGDVLLSGVGEVVVGAVEATVEGAGIVLSVVGQAAGSVISGTLDGL